MADFNQRLVLNHWLLAQLGVHQFEALSEQLHQPELAGITEDGHTRFCIRLLDWMPEGKREINNDALREYDLNIVKHWQRITEKRRHAQAGNADLNLLYFQWLALLFNEIYLDAYWRDSSALCAELNQHLHSFNLGLTKKLKLPPFEEAELNKLSFWMATGSGKTLLMHVHYLQLHHYLNKHNKQRQIEQTILLTPNRRLSEQHKKELDDSGINADLFSKNRGGPNAGFDFGIQIIDIHKLKDKAGEETVDVASFEGRNLVLVDEGHRGSGGDDWLNKRKQLCEQGFSYEYSATFEQAINAAAAKKKEALAQLYAKNIVLDYSYRYFYQDGFGKDYRILNLQDHRLEEHRELYLTGCLLAFFQQCKLFADKGTAIKPYLLANPLAIFVGGTVTGRADAEQQSDIAIVVNLLASFLKQPAKFTGYLEQLRCGRDSLLNANGNRVFDDAFVYLQQQYDDAEAIYADLCTTVFNAPNGGLLHIEELKGTDGELALYAGEGQDYFAVINVGDPAKLRKLLEASAETEDQPLYAVGERAFAGSLFTDINKTDSRIRLLIGAKKFTEGWSSWRVSTMGLLNIGRNKGSEIIQLFGRGVRLKGYGFGLQRSGYVMRDDGATHPEHLSYLETLNVFGVRADYMEEFKQFLEDQGMEDEPDYRMFTLPVVNTPGSEELAALELKTLRPKEGLNPFKNAERPVLGLLPKGHDGGVVLDWYPRITAKKGKHGQKGLQLDGGQAIANKHSAIFSEQQLSFINWDALLFELVAFKNARSWHNLQLDKGMMQALLARSDWYTLYVPESEWVFGREFSRIHTWQEVAAALLKKYLERFYLVKKQEYEAPYLEYQTLKTSDANYVKEYQVQVAKSDAAMLAVMEKAEAALNAATGVVDLQSHGNLHFIGNELHLYFPLVQLEGKNNKVKVSPVHLNDGEADFVNDLAKWVNSKPTLLEGRELHLLRNQVRKGVGFFEAGNFYPDFMLWITEGEKQWLTFIDPKGLRNIRDGLSNPKIQLAKSIKDLEQEYADTAGGKQIVLNSFILSNTPKHEVDWWEEDKAFVEHHVLFQRDYRDRYIGDMVSSIVH